MNELAEQAEPVVISLMREGQMICVSIYAQLPEGEAGERMYATQLAICTQQAIELDVSFIVEDLPHGL